MAAQVQSASHLQQQFPLFNYNSFDVPPHRPLYTQAPQSRQPPHGGSSSSSRPRSPQVALPLRSSYPNPTSYPPHASSQNASAPQEDFLRRKTPSGTLVGAYNGTFAESDIRPQASKHLLMPSSNDARRQSHARAPADSSVSGKRASMGSQGPFVHTGHPGPLSWQGETTAFSPQADSLLNSAPAFYSAMDWQYTQNQLPHMMPPLQAPMGPTVSNEFQGSNHLWPQDQNIAGFHVPSLDVSAPAPSWPSAMHTNLQLNHGPNNPFTAVHGHHMPPFEPHAVQQTYSQRFTNPASNVPRPTHSFSDPRLKAQQSSQGANGHGVFSDLTGQGWGNAISVPEAPSVDYDTPEQVLRRGYTIYRDLLSVLQRTRSSGSAIPRLTRSTGPVSSDRIAAQAQALRQRSAAAGFWGRDRPWPARALQGRLAQSQHPATEARATTVQAQRSALHAAVPADSALNRWSSEAELRMAGHTVIHALNKLCELENGEWVEAMLLDGCISYVLGEHDNAVRWYSRILKVDSNHVEASSNLAATYLAQNRRREAEQYWRLAVHLRPHYFEAVEQLVQLLCLDRRQKEAVQIIDHIQSVLKPQASHDQKQGNARSSLQRPTQPEGRYSNPVIDNGRLMALIHAKGNILYNMHDQMGAAEAFQEVVLIAAGYASGGIDALINAILSSLSCFAGRPGEQVNHSVRDHLLLPPEKALQTAKLCFPQHGALPGLDQIREGAAKRSAISLTSNSLLSLAKVFQDGMNANANQHFNFKSHHGVRNILALYYLSLSLQPSPSTANNVGILLASVQQSVKSKPIAPADSFMFPGLVPGSGVALALMYYQYGLKLDSKHAHLYTNLGSLLKDIGQLPVAVQMYEQAVKCDSTFDIALANLANAVKDQGKVSEAIKYYRKAVEVNPDFSEAVCGLANALNSVCDWKGRGGVKLDRGLLDRWHVNADGELRDSQKTEQNTAGWISRVVDVVETQLVEGRNWGRHLITDSYVEQLSQSLAIIGSTDRRRTAERKEAISNLLFSWKGQCWEGARLVWLVERATKWIARQWYLDRYFRRRALPDSTYARPRLPTALAIPGAPTVLPFHTFTLPVNARQVRLISQRNGLRVSTSTLRASWLPSTVYRPPPPPAPQIKVGYISSDFNNHPLAHLMQSVFGMHDKTRITAYCYATTASDNSVHRRQIENEAPSFCDASSWPLEKLLQQIVADGIHVLVNLNGYTRGARNEIFAARPAPIQMSFMGFAGTLGAEWCDYLLADEVAVPPASLRPGRRNVDPFDLASVDDSADNDSWVYAENIVYTRSTFFCCDHRQSACTDAAKEQSLTWADEQRRRWRMRKELFPNLPDDAIIFGNFNQLYKIDPTTFRTWLRILSRVPNAYLWLLRFPADGQANLQQTAQQWAGSHIASRIIFTDVAAKTTHIARGCIADLFLDTPECNAHTTAADCLWSGTPLLTLPRYQWKMCSRMAAGILGGALDRSSPEGRRAWGDLVAQSEEDYEERAVRLGSALSYASARNGVGAQGRLMELRKIIWEGRWTCDLFDTKRWVRDLETAYDEAWRRWVNGEGGDIWLKDLCDAS